MSELKFSVFMLAIVFYSRKVSKSAIDFSELKWFVVNYLVRDVPICIANASSYDWLMFCNFGRNLDRQVCQAEKCYFATLWIVCRFWNSNGLCIKCLCNFILLVKFSSFNAAELVIICRRAAFLHFCWLRECFSCMKCIICALSINFRVLCAFFVSFGSWEKFLLTS